MNQIFDFSRFWRFFKFDMTRTVRSNFIKLVSFVVSPVCAFIVYGFMSLILGNGWTNVGVITRLPFFLIVSVIFFIFYSANCYGFLTEKNAGSSWLMIPASVTEKYVTMLLNVLVVAPVVYLVLTLALDWIYSVIFSDGSGSIVAYLFSSFGEATNIISATNLSPLKISRASVYAMVQPSSWTPLLAFMLGGICFKKSKIAKTILCSFAFLMIFSTVMSLVFGIISDGTFDFLDGWMDNPRTGEILINAVIFAITAVPCIALAVAVYFRLKTIKH
ncbi:MAG: hypothetical protein MJZ16_02300 [Bacteroidales bacterium]|nr:hypothetical protein [Bacteroidales bacterium]